MGHLERVEALDDLGNLDAPTGSRPWAVAVANKIRVALYDNKQSGTMLQSLVNLFRQHEGYTALGFRSWDVFCIDRLHSVPEQIEVTITMRLAMQATPIRRHGTNQHAAGGDNYNILDSRGTGNEYLTARIARDAPEILDRMKSGDYPSVRAAAVAAGIIDPEKSRRYSLPTSPRDAARYLKERVSAEWVNEFIEALRE